jgi:hypothetical protein
VPYTRFVKTKKGVAVYKRTKGGKEVKAFTAHTKSVAKAKRTAGIGESHARRKA